VEGTSGEKKTSFQFSVYKLIQPTINFTFT